MQRETTSPLLTPELMRQLERLEFVTRKVFAGRMKGERRSRRKGQSVEFADFRNYVAGDDLRFIDWNLFARLDRLFLKLFFEEEDLHFYVLVDDSPSMSFGSPTKLEYAKQLAAALGFVGLVRADRVKVEALSGAVSPSPALRGRKSMVRLLDYLDKIEPVAARPLADSLKSFAIRNSGKGIVVLATDLLDKAGYQAALRYLVAKQMDVYVVQILSAEELDPGVKGDLKLVDCEDGDTAEITVSAPLLKRYKQTVAAFVEGARDFCVRRGMSYVLANTDLPIEQLVALHLRSRGLVR